ncbi:hypothetical protein P5673_001918 [Acropora cervicornis]|uniref:Uncharacterized protein n=1 Tax=Acropora cervicornis TaxID=6130 RepID=A0AAD9R4C5_ACRCE|nr:hypothetical protein P5673_001918 [Acropora cervicornis]
MNFKLKFLCVLFVNFLPQSFASPENLGSRRVDDVVDKLENLRAAVESLSKLVKENGYVKSTEPRSKRESGRKTPSTEKEAPTTSQSTPKTVSGTPTTNVGTLSTPEVPITLEMKMTTEPELETSSYSPTTLVAATKVSEATLQAGSSELPANPTTLEPSKKNDRIKLDEVLDKLENLQAAVESLRKLIMAENVSQLSTAAREIEPKSPSSEETTPKTISETPTTNLGTLRTGLENIFSNYSSATRNISEATLQAGSNELPGNSTTLAPSKKNDSTKSEQESPSTRKAKQTESRDDGSLINRSHFPTIFMVILVIVVVTYMIYHSRIKIHNFIKKHRSRDQESGPGYVKVKVDDDLDLPRDANRHYVY